MKNKKINLFHSDRVMEAFVYALMTLLMLIILYPVIYVVSSSFSSGSAVTGGKVIFLPVDFSLTGYKIVFSYRQVWTGYFNTILYTVGGTAISMFLTIPAAYVLSRREVQWKKFYILFFMITMFFSGGLIPQYLLIVKLGLINTRWSVLLSGCFSCYNMILMRTFFQNSIPGDLFDAAKIDGITDIGYLFRIILPLSKAILAVVILYYAVGRWNSYFNAMIYLQDRDYYPLQLVLRDVLNASNVDLSEITDPELVAKMAGAADVMKHALIVVSTVPMLIAYPFVQKFFEKGVMIGSVKG